VGILARGIRAGDASAFCAPLAFIVEMRVLPSPNRQNRTKEVSIWQVSLKKFRFYMFFIPETSVYSPREVIRAALAAASF
jgi:hypothetical protein